MDATNQENTDVAAEPSVFHSSLSVETKVERARTELLDLSARNRLLNVPRFSKSAKTIDIVDEKSAEIYRILVTQGKPMTFLAGAKGRDGDNADEEGMVELALPDDDERDENGLLIRHADTKLHTSRRFGSWRGGTRWIHLVNMELLSRRCRRNVRSRWTIFWTPISAPVMRLVR
jgi:hypothetical protein